MEEIGRSQVPDLIAGQGLLWYQRSFDGERMLGHNGGDFGVATQMFVRQRDGTGVIVLQNASSYVRMVRIEALLWQVAENL